MSPKPISRRNAIKLLGCTTALPVVAGCDHADGDAPSNVRRPRPTTYWTGPAPVDMNEFPAGVQSGEATPSSLLLWCKPVNASELTLHYALWDGYRWLEGTPLPIEMGADKYTHFVLEQLSSDTPVAYQFVTSDGLGSPTYSSTAISNAAPVRFGIISCTKQPWAPFPALTALSQMPIDLCLHLGDTSYNDGAKTLAEYRAKWAETLRQSGYVDLHQSCSSVITWDDHEIYNNWDRESVSSFSLDVATTAFSKHYPSNPTMI